jgi:hypothetical protein
MNSDVDWAAQAKHFQQDLGKQWAQALQSLQPGRRPAPRPTQFSPDQAAGAAAGVRARSQRAVEPGPGRAPAGRQALRHDAWARNPVAAFSAAVYLLNARTLLGLAEATDADAKTKARLRFAVEQWMAASAPSNFIALNAEAQQKAMETRGESIARGMQNLLADLQQGHVSMTDEKRLRSRPQRRDHRRRGGVRERAVPADRIQAADQAGVRAPLPGGAALHQQVLHPRPAAGELADPLPGRSRAIALSS